MSESIRQEFAKHWKLLKSSSPKLEFYNQIKEEFCTEDYLSMIKNPSHRASVTRLRISAHNLFVERGRYENPIVPREDRWCIFCYVNTGIKHIENEDHVLLHCPLYHAKLSCTNRETPPNLKNLLKYSGKDKRFFILLGKSVHEILEINKYHTAYYLNSQGFHTKTGVLCSKS